jgi:anthranilate synthase/phosphoribosyltransferase
MILVIDNYDSFTYNLVQMIAALGAEVEVERNDEITPDAAVAMAPDAIVVSPGPGTPADAGISVGVVRAAAEAGIPLLGVCLGHQAVAEAFGATVSRGESPVHGKTANVSHTGKGILAGVPSPFVATRYHSLAVVPSSLPDDLEATALTDDGVIMAIQHRRLPVYGVQFHPESVLTPEGERVLENFLAVAGTGSSATDEEAGKKDTPRRTRVPEALDVQSAIKRVIDGGSLAEREARAVMDSIMDGEATPSQIASLLTALRMKGETVPEITGFARSMRAHSTAVHASAEGLLDTCGTGGDASDSFNVSTVTAFVVAGAGVPIAKHGNRSVSSACGSADVLEALGVRIDIDAEAMGRCIDEAGVGFLFAQALHPSMRHAGPTRREMAVRTVFNLLGPLTNPAGARRQLLGVYDRELVPTVADVAARLGAERVLVVHGHPGIDEVSASGPTAVSEYSDGEHSDYEITPEEFGVARVSEEAIRGGDPETNAAIARSVLTGERGAPRETVLMNAACALYAAGAVEDIAAGVEEARRSIDEGAALSRLEALVTVSGRLAEDEAPVGA